MGSEMCIRDSYLDDDHSDICFASIVRFDSDDAVNDDECVSDRYEFVDYDEALWKVQSWLDDNVFDEWLL